MKTPYHRPAGVRADALSRLHYGDAIRVLGCLAVILLHVSTNGASSSSPIGSWDWWIYNVASSACRWAVPVFLMLSGALLLHPRKTETPGHFYRKRASRIGPPLLLWSAFYFLWARLRTSPSASPALLIKGFLGSLLYGGPHFHLYFLFVLLGLYLCVPMLRLLVRSVEPRALRSLACLLLLAAMLETLCRKASGWGLDSFLMFTPYVGYFLLGHCLSIQHAGHRRLRRAWTAAVACTILTALGTAYTLSHWRNVEFAYYFWDNLSPTVICLSVAVFVLLGSAASAPAFRRFLESPPAQTLSACSFGIYLVHPFFLELLTIGGLRPAAAHSWVYLPAAFGITAGASFLTTALIRKVPLGRVIVG